jgi:hypothetical protein
VRRSTSPPANPSNAAPSTATTPAVSSNAAGRWSGGEPTPNSLSPLSDSTTGHTPDHPSEPDPRRSRATSLKPPGEMSDGQELQDVLMATRERASRVPSSRSACVRNIRDMLDMQVIVRAPSTICTAPRSPCISGIM